jgi:hypothetical protein
MSKTLFHRWNSQGSCPILSLQRNTTADGLVYLALILDLLKEFGNRQYGIRIPHTDRNNLSLAMPCLESDRDLYLPKHTKLPLGAHPSPKSRVVKSLRICCKLSKTIQQL